MRMGIGWDSHRLGEGQLLVLAGVEIPFFRGLLGHSDADVLLHAIIDALLGAAALPDIGTQFPDTDETWRGVSSLELLRRTAALIKEAGFCINNIDSTVIAEQPKLASYILAMRQNIAAALAIDICCVSVKAKTAEGLDSVGRGEAMQAQAVAAIEEKRTIFRKI